MTEPVAKFAGGDRARMATGRGSALHNMRRLNSDPIKGTLWNGAGLAVYQILNLATTPILLHALGVASFGVWALLQTTVTLTVALDGGIGASAQRYYALHIASGGHKGAAPWTALFLSIVVLFTFLAWAISPVVSSLIVAISHPPRGLVGPIQDIFQFLGPIIGLTLLNSVLFSLLRAVDKFRPVALTLAVGQLFFLLSVWLQRDSLSLGKTVALLVAQLLIQTVVALTLNVGHLRELRPRLPSRIDRQAFYRYAGRSQIVNLSSLSILQFDSFFVAAFANLKDVAYLEIALQISSAIRSVPLFTMSPLLSWMTQKFAISSSAMKRASMQVATIWSDGITRYGIVVVLASPFLVRGWTGEEQAAMIGALILTLGNVFNLMTGVGTAYCRAIGRNEYEARYAIVLLAANLVLSVPCTYFWGVLGAATSTMAAQMIGYAVFSRQLRGDLGVEIGPIRRMDRLHVLSGLVVIGIGCATLATTGGTLLTLGLSLVAVLVGLSISALSRISIPSITRRTPILTLRERGPLLWSAGLVLFTAMLIPGHPKVAIAITTFTGVLAVTFLSRLRPAQILCGLPIAIVLPLTTTISLSGHSMQVGPGDLLIVLAWFLSSAKRQCEVGRRQHIWTMANVAICGSAILSLMASSDLIRSLYGVKMVVATAAVAILAGRDPHGRLLFRSVLRASIAAGVLAVIEVAYDGGSALLSGASAPSTTVQDISLIHNSSDLVSLSVGRSNYAAAIIVLGFVSALLLWLLSEGPKDRWLAGIGAVSAVLGVVMTASRTQMISIAAVIVLVGLLPQSSEHGTAAKQLARRRRGLLLYMVPVAGILGSLILPLVKKTFSPVIASGLTGYSSVQERVELWRAAVRVFQSHPLLGEGVSSVSLNTPFGTMPMAHDTFLQVLAETGAVGLFIYLAAFAAGLHACRGIYRYAMLVLGVSMLVSGLAEPTMRTGPYDEIAWLLLGACVAAGAKNSASMALSRLRLLRPRSSKDEP